MSALKPVSLSASRCREGSPPRFTVLSISVSEGQALRLSSYVGGFTVSLSANRAGKASPRFVVLSTAHDQRWAESFLLCLQFYCLAQVQRVPRGLFPSP